MIPGILQGYYHIPPEIVARLRAWRDTIPKYEDYEECTCSSDVTYHIRDTGIGDDITATCRNHKTGKTHSLSFHCDDDGEWVVGEERTGIFVKRSEFVLMYEIQDSGNHPICIKGTKNPLTFLRVEDALRFREANDWSGAEEEDETERDEELVRLGIKKSEPPHYWTRGDMKNCWVQLHEPTNQPFD